MTRFVNKVIRVGDSLSLTIPAVVLRDLGIRRGDTFNLYITSDFCLLYEKVKTVPVYDDPMPRDPSVELIQND